MSEPVYYDFRGRGLALARNLPMDFYGQSRTEGELISTLGREFDHVRGAVWSVLQQFFPQSATYAIASWEWENGLSIAPSMPLNDRRSRVLARLRGYGTTTMSRIRIVANSFENGTVEVIPDPNRYTLILRFADVHGEPPNLSALVDAIKLILPAHLFLKIERTYTTWAMVNEVDEDWTAFNARGLTWGDLGSYL